MRPEEYDVWLFDLDGTVVDCEPSYARGVFDRTGATTSPTDRSRICGTG